MSFSLLAPLAAGVGIVLMERWDAAEALRLIEAHRITHTHMVPTMFHRLLQLPRAEREAADVSSLTYVLHGAAPCPPVTKAAMLDWFGPVIWEYYAATEGSAASIGPEEWLEHPGSVGRPPTPGHVRIVGDDGEECDPGVAGEIQIARVEGADFVYLNDPQKTERTRRGDYFTVGDVGYLDDDGYLFVTDRSDDLILRGGVNVYPAEVEAALLTHPGVRDAAVVGVPDAEWGEQVVAVVERNSVQGDTSSFLAALAGHCAQELAGFKCPSRIEVTDALPRGDNGKLHRRTVRDRMREVARPPAGVPGPTPTEGS
jgi:long-chain acyl-CoA synthetase